jgi:hypothetical protein
MKACRTLWEKELSVFMGSRSSLEPEPARSMEEVMIRPHAAKIWSPEEKLFNSSET